MRRIPIPLAQLWFGIVMVSLVTSPAIAGTAIGHQGGLALDHTESVAGGATPAASVLEGDTVIDREGDDELRDYTAQTQDNYTDADGAVRPDGVFDAAADFRDGAISASTLLDVVSQYRASDYHRFDRHAPPLESSDGGAVTRDITETELEPGETTTVTVAINLTEQLSHLEWITDVDPAVANIDLVEDDGATTSSSHGSGNQALASWSWDDRTTATLTYEVTLPDDADSGDTITINGTITDRANVTRGVGGDSTISVVDPDSSDGSDDGQTAGTVDSAERTISNRSPAPGETVDVTVDVQLDGSGDITVEETVSPPPGHLRVTDSNGANSTSDVRDELTAVWTDADSATLGYQVTIPTSAVEGDTFTIAGTANGQNVSGEDTITVSDLEDSGGEEVPEIESAERTISDTSPVPGETVEVTVDVQVNGSEEVDVVESVSPRPGGVRVTDRGTARSTSDDADTASAVWDTTDSATFAYQVTIPTSARAGETFTITGSANGQTIAGDSDITVSSFADADPEDAPEIASAERTISDTSPVPGETVEVTVDVQVNGSEWVDIVESTSPPPGDMRVTDRGTARSTSDSGDVVSAVWDTTDSATLVYQVTIPTSARVGETFTIVGTANGQAIAGDSEVTVSESGESGDDDAPEIESAERTIGTTSPAPGETVAVTVDVQLGSSDEVEVIESVSPPPGDVRVTNRGEARSSSDARDTASAIWDTTDSATLVYQVTIPADAAAGETFTITGTANGQEIAGVSEITVRSGEDGDVGGDVPLAGRVVSFGTILDAIGTYNVNRTIDDQPIGYQDVLSIVRAFTTGETVPGPISSGASADVAVTAPDSVQPGESFEATYELTNDGTDDANAAGLALSSPPDIEPTAASGDGSPALNQGSVFYISGLSATETVTTNVTFSVADSASGSLRVGGEATVGADTGSASTTVMVEEDDATERDLAERTISTTSPAPGETVTVTVDARRENTGDIDIQEAVSPAPGSIRIADDSGAFVSSASSTEVNAAWRDTDAATLVYDVTIPDAATDGDTFTISGTANGQAITGASEITVRSGESGDDVTGNGSLSATRSIASPTVPAGESAEVTVTIQTATTIEDLRLVDGFDPSLSASIVDDDGATISSPTTDKVAASWGGVSGATLTYEVTVPDVASNGTTYVLSGTVEDRDAGTEVSIGGDTTIEVGEPGDPLAAYADPETGRIETTGLLDAAADFRSGEIETSVLLEIAAAFRSGDPVV